MARACDIAGAPVKATLLDEQLVIYRIKGRGSRPRRLPAPRGAADRFHEEEGIVCPYHGLRFGEDGRCNRIPSSPGQPIPAKLHLTSFAVEERYGLIWTCTACDPDNPPPLPTMPHWDDAGFQQINCPAFEVKGFAGRRSKAFSMSPTSRGSTPTPSPIRTTSRCRTIARRRRRSALLPTTGARWAITGQL
ncbi:Rieske 2Fe-2S domain-containing protein [Klebsiella pneumoniae]|uniref:Rieske 2Fe-2S domain-containing protein n=1 Tax=Klebsiella pneumoniae TaxID=573 RepID=A0A923EP28_KLEPN|nr:Rieske 2Fe-2S domain-containing protein [Klebsiella pneumoniae]